MDINPVSETEFTLAFVRLDIHISTFLATAISMSASLSCLTFKVEVITHSFLILDYCDINYEVIPQLYVQYLAVFRQLYTET